MDPFLRELPKAELHVHVEGTLEPEATVHIAARNGVVCPFASPEAARKAYDFSGLQSFLDVYYAAISVLRTADDFYELGAAYFDRACADGVLRAEIFFDPQAHTDRGVSLNAVIDGLGEAVDEARTLHGISGGLIGCFLRDRGAEAAAKTLADLLRRRDRLLGVGLDSAELGHPPREFAAVFARARAEGLHLVAHAGEEGPPEDIREALDLLHAERIDHGVRAEEDPDLVERLVRERVPLTVCPLSNLKLRVVATLEDHNLRRLLARGARVTIHSDDPAYFGGYIADNYEAAQKALGLSEAEIVMMARHSFEAAFVDDAERARFLRRLDAYVKDAHRESLAGGNAC